MRLPLAYNVRNVVVRWQVTALAVLAIGLVVAVVVVLMAMAEGFRLALRATGRPGNAVAIQRGSNSEVTSWMSRDAANVIIDDPRVARRANGQPLASCELLVVGSLPRRGGGAEVSVTIRGVAPVAFDVRGGIRLLEGRRPSPALHEMLVGRGIQRRVAGLDLGQRVSIEGREWDVVGTFAAEGSAFESEIWTDAQAMSATLLRYGGCNSLALTLSDASALFAFDAEIQADPRMQLQLKDERKYYEDQSRPVARPLKALAGLVGMVMGLGAVFGAMNTMYTVVSVRTREIGTLRALGFSRRSVLLAVVMESTVLAAAGALLGCLLAVPFHGFTAASANTAGFAEVTWAFRVTGATLGAGVAFALVIGVIGSLLPALRAASRPISAALRDA
jgi:putative ABC transport system permease protein